MDSLQAHKNYARNFQRKIKPFMNTHLFHLLSVLFLFLVKGFVSHGRVTGMAVIRRHGTAILIFLEMRQACHPCTGLFGHPLLRTLCGVVEIAGIANG